MTDCFDDTFGSFGSLFLWLEVCSFARGSTGIWGAGPISVACISLSAWGAKEGLLGERAAGEVFERCSGEARFPDAEGDTSRTVNRDGVEGKSENAGLFVGWGEVARRGLSNFAFSSNSRSFNASASLTVLSLSRVACRLASKEDDVIVVAGF